MRIHLRTLIKKTKKVDMMYEWWVKGQPENKWRGNNFKFFKMGNHKEEQLAMQEQPDTVKNIKRVSIQSKLPDLKKTWSSYQMIFNLIAKMYHHLCIFLIIMVEWHLTFFEWTFDLRCLTTTLFSAPLNGHRGHLKGFSPVWVLSWRLIL